jgi:predicted nucleotide-binding protein
MAKRGRQEEPEIPGSIPPAQSIPLLRRQIVRVQELVNTRPINTSAHDAWENTTRELLIAAFGSRSQNIDKVIYASQGPMRMGMSDREFDESLAVKLRNQIGLLESCVDQLELLSPGATAISATKDAEAAMNTKVFVVHGQNDQVKTSVSQTIERLGLQPIILHEQANQGMTLIEKFAHHSDAGFAVILLTADDFGRAKHSDQLKPRARQNVVFEFGFFIDKLGRNKVCALYEEGVELPSDLSGFTYTTLDPSGHWKLELVRELKAAGYPVDANKLL